MPLKINIIYIKYNFLDRRKFIMGIIVSTSLAVTPFTFGERYVIKRYNISSMKHILCVFTKNAR